MTFATIPPNLLATTQEIDTEKKWIWLFELEADATTVETIVVTFTSHDAEVVRDGKTYAPYPSAHSPIEVDGEGSLPRVDLTVSNITRELVPYVNHGEGFLGRPAFLKLTTLDQSAVPDEVASLELSGAGVEVRDTEIVFSLEGLNLYDREFPPSVFSRDRCPVGFKGPRCRYRGPELTCLKRITDCEMFGNAEVARGYPRLHPRLFGGFPGLTRKVS